MKGNIFIEGYAQSGKSDFLQLCVRDYRKYAAGYYTQRMHGGYGNEVIAYRLTSISAELPLDIPYNSMMSNVFIKRNSNSFETDMTVFENAALKFISDIKGKKFIVMDEIGGIELLVPSFRKALYEALAGDIACIGILKSQKGSDEVRRNLRIPDRCYELNRKLRHDMLHEFDNTIVTFDADTGLQTEEKIRQFIEQAITLG